MRNPATDRADRILALLDQPGQDSAEASYGDHVGGRCWRCNRHPDETESGMCEGCRSFMLGDTEADPKDWLPSLGMTPAFAVEDEALEWHPASETIAEYAAAARGFTSWLAAATMGAYRTRVILGHPSGRVFTAPPGTPPPDLSSPAGPVGISSGWSDVGYIAEWDEGAWRRPVDLERQWNTHRVSRRPTRATALSDDPDERPPVNGEP